VILLNFSHPLTDEQLARVEALIGSSVECVVDLTAHFDHTRPFTEQVTALADRAGLSSHEWQTLPLVVNPPAFNFIAVALLAELHGRMGYFPTVLRLRPVPESTPPRFEVAELINLQAIRDTARERRDEAAS
jgi:hypothetical protein